ncbi:MAG: SMP-30/gluconolactonase/LRE family protein, partial [Vicinamibacterales bacterium]
PLGGGSKMRRLLIVFSSFALALALVQPVLAVKPFPEVLPLPDGFQPEGIAIGPGTTYYVGSIPTGAIFRGDLRTGEGGLLVEPTEGRMAIGLAVDNSGRRLFVAGGPTGQAYVYDASTGDELAVYRLTELPTFINDVVVTREAAYFTDSRQPVIYRVALGPGGEPGSTVETIPLGGDFEFVAGAFNANGIDATPNGETLIIVNSTLGTLYTVNPATGVAQEIDLGGATVVNGDGILLDDETLYVVQNRFNQIAVIRLSADLSEGEVVAHITDPNFRVPTTIAEFGNRLYAVNARFGTPPTPTTEYEIVQVQKQ